MLAARRRSTVLLDFLAPSLSRRLFVDVPQKKLALEAASRPVLHSKIESPELARLPLSVPLASKSQAEAYNTSINHIRRAIRANHLAHVLERWTLLQDKGLVHFLAHPDLQALTTFVAQLFTSNADIPSHLQQQVQDFAVQLAVLYSHDALNACLLYFLEAEQWETVIAIHRQFIEADRKANELKNELLNEDSAQSIYSALLPDDSRPSLASDTFATDTLFDRDATAPGIVRTNLIVVAAYARLNRLRDAFTAVRENDMRFTISETQDFVQNSAPAFRAQLEKFIQCIKTASIVSLPVALSKRIKYLSMTSKSSGALEGVYKEIIGGLEGPNPFLSVNPKTPKGCLVSVDETTWTCFLVAFIKARDDRMVLQLWRDIDRFRVTPGAHLFTAFIDACSAVRNVEGVTTAWKLMHARRIPPDNLTFRAMISALYYGKLREAADKAFETYRTTVGSRLPATDQLIVYNTALAGMLGLYREEQALNVLKSMEENSPFPDIITYNTFLSFYGRKSDFRSISAMLERMTEHGVVGDVQTFSTVLSALLKVGTKNATDVVLGIMKKQGIQPNVVTHTSILQSQMAEKTDGSLKAALDLLRRMEADPDLQPNEKTYAVVLKNIRWLPPGRAAQIRDDILSRVTKRIVRLSEATYNTLIYNAFTDNSTGQGLEDVLIYYQHMKRSGVTPSWRTYYLLLSQLRKLQEWSIADEIIGDLYMGGLRAGKPLMDLMTRIKNRDKGVWQ